MGRLVLVRHGQSQWNLENRFTGWTDVPLSERGKSDAVLCAKALGEFNFSRVFTSRLLRATQTLEIMLRTLKINIPVENDSALNERHYGDLQGLNKAETAEKYGKEQVQKWRRSFFTRPPDTSGEGESMEDCDRRTRPFFRQYILPFVTEKNEDVLVVAHGNSMRPIIKYLERLEPEMTAKLELGLCVPYIYTFEGENMMKNEIREIPGALTKGSSLTEKRVESS